MHMQTDMEERMSIIIYP